MKEFIVFIAIFIFAISVINHQFEMSRYIEERRATSYPREDELMLDYHINNGYNILNAMKRNQL